jgi:hypothetical protein
LGGAALQRCDKRSVLISGFTDCGKTRFVSGHRFSDAISALIFQPPLSRGCGCDPDFFRSLQSLMKNLKLDPLPSGVRAIAALFALCGAYLGLAGLLMLARPGLLGMWVGDPLLFGLELAGPYMFLLTGAVAGTVAWGLVKRNNIMRHAAILIAIAGVVMLVPAVSAAAITVRAKALAFGGLGIIVRVMVAWFLSQSRVANEFRR